MLLAVVSRRFNQIQLLATFVVRDFLSLFTGLFHRRLADIVPKETFVSSQTE